MTRQLRAVLVFTGVVSLYVLSFGASAWLKQVPEAIAHRGYAGDDACVKCHAEQVKSYLHTAHHLTSSRMLEGASQGSFAEGANEMTVAEPAPSIGDPGVAYRMEQRDGGYFVTAITGMTGATERRSERMDLVVGSGVRGQSFLSWRGDRLFELPVSLWTDGRQWINSPGYRNGPPNFDRPATARCLECHFSYAEALSGDTASNRFARSSISTGLSCEVCHGPGARHVAAFQSQDAAARHGGTWILNPRHFTRDRQVDLCALCHNGADRAEIAPAFSYVPGEPLSRYLQEPANELDEHPDVHASQVGLLKRSRCYLGSPAMSCSTCHDVHAAEQPAASYSTKCLQCHKVESCGIESRRGPSIASNCVDCHMPVERTNAIVSQTGNKVVRTSMRTHWIKVYPGLE